MNFSRFTLLLLFFPAITYSQPSETTQTIRQDKTINVYLDCRGCSENFIRTEISFVNFVRDLADGDVHLLITRQQTGSRGQQYTLNYMGRSLLNDQSKQIKFVSPESDTNEMRRNRLVKYIKLGLVSFLTDRAVLADLNLNFEGNPDTPVSTVQKDPWNSWVFELGMSTNFSGEQTRNNFRVNGNIDARRITEDWKINLNYDQNYNRRSFTSEDDDGEEVTDTYIVENKSFFGLIAKSLSDHWTVGAYKRARTSTQDNINLSIGATPSVEFSVFPYNEYTRREITMRYGILGSYYDYTEPTIFGVDEEFLWWEELNVRMDFTQPWGGMYGWLDAGNYMHDFSKNRVNVGLQFNMRVLRGLSVFVSGRYALINNQLSLPAGDSTEEELLLNLKQQATAYNYGGSIGFEFNFGSVYNNVVNSRF